MDNIFQWEDYKPFLQAWLKEYGKNNRGALSRLAEHLAVQPSFISQILSGDKDFSIEQTLAVSEFLGLSESGCDYLLLMVLKARAGTRKMQSYFKRKCLAAQKMAKNYRAIAEESHTLTEQDHALFYSSACYSKARILTSMPGYQSVQALSQALQVPPARVNQIVSFLIERGLCRYDASGSIVMGPNRTYLAPGSPFVKNHHRNWRLEAMQLHESMEDDDLAFSGPLSISQADFLAVRTLLLELIEEVGTIVEKSPPEVFVTFNVDWLRLQQRP